MYKCPLAISIDAYKRINSNNKISSEKSYPKQGNVCTSEHECLV